MYFKDPYIELLEKSEGEIGEALGIPRDDMRKVRNRMTPGVDYTREIHNKVKYTATGLEKVLQYVGLRVELNDGPIAGKVKAFPQNKNLMIVELADGREVRTRIKSSNHLKVGMLVEVKKEPGGIFMLSSPYPNPSRFITLI